jgi:hypothetical protein
MGVRKFTRMRNWQTSATLLVLPIGDAERVVVDSVRRARNNRKGLACGRPPAVERATGSGARRKAAELGVVADALEVLVRAEGGAGRAEDAQPVEATKILNNPNQRIKATHCCNVAHKHMPNCLTVIGFALR